MSCVNSPCFSMHSLVRYYGRLCKLIKAEIFMVSLCKYLSPPYRYLALFMVGWTPALWTVGYRIISSGDADEDSRGNATRQGLSWLTLADWFESIMNPPLYGVSS